MHSRTKLDGDWVLKTYVMSSELSPGDKVKFRRGHPWAGEVGSFVELIRTPVGELHVFEVLGKAGLTAGAKPSQFSKI